MKRLPFVSTSYRALSFICVIMFALIACTQEEPTEILRYVDVTVVVTSTETPIETSPTPTATIVPTNLPQPTDTLAPEPTDTPQPTNTPVPTQVASVFEGISAENAHLINATGAPLGGEALGGVGYLPDGNVLFKLTSTGLYLLDPNDMSELQYIELGPLSSLASNADASLLIVLRPDGQKLDLWDATTNTRIDQIDFTSENEDRRLTTVTMTRDGSHFMTGTSDGTIHVVNTETFDLVWSEQIFEDIPVEWINTSPDGSLIFAHDTGTIKVIDAVTGEELSAWDHSDWRISAVAIAQDGRTVASAGRDGLVKVWRVGQATPINGSVESENDNVYALAFSDDGSLLALGYDTGHIRLHRVSDGRLEQTFPNAHRGWVFSLSFSADGQSLSSTGSDAIINLWDVASRQTTQTQQHAPALYGVHCTSAGEIITLSDDWKTRVYASDGTLLRDYNTFLPLTLAVSPDETQIVVGSLNGELSINPVSGEPITTQESLSIQPQDITFSPDGRQFVVSAQDGEVSIWRTADGSVQTTLSDPSITFMGQVALNPQDETMLVTSTNAGLAHWNLSTNTFEQIVGWDGHQYAMTFSPSGKYIISGDAFGWFLVTDVTTGDITAVPDLVHNDVIGDIVFAPGGEIFVTASGDTRLGVWRWLGNGEVEFVKILEGHTRGVSDVAFCPDGNTIVSSSYDGTVRFWQISTDA